MQEPIHLELLDTEKFQQFFNSFDHVCCDCDGVLVLFGKVLTGATETIELFRKNGKKVTFVSNNTLLLTREYLSKLEKLGFHPTPEDLITPIHVAVDYLKKTKFNKAIYCISFKGLKEELADSKFQIIDARQDLNEENEMGIYLKHLDELDPRVGAVYFDIDFMFRGISIQKAIRYLQEPHVEFFGSGSDKIIPIKEKLQLIGPGYFHQILSEMSGKIPILFGKPGTNMKNYLLNKISHPSRVIFVGDSLEQDIKLGKMCGFKTLFVLTGVNKLSDLKEKAYQNIRPEYIVKSLDSFRNLIEKHLKYIKK